MNYRRIAKWTGGVAIVAVGFMGFLHTPLGRPLLIALGRAGVGGCPAGFDKMKPEALEEQRVGAMQPLRGDARAPAHPALTFDLAKATKADVVAWADSRGMACGEEMKGAALRCTGGQPTPLDGSIPLRDAFFRFAPGGALVAVDVMREGTEPAAGAACVDEVTARLSTVLGVPTKDARSGASQLGEPLASVSVEFRFRDYAVDVAATNLGDRGVVVREQYRAIPD